MERVGINDEKVICHLKNDVVQDRFSPILSVDIRDFPNESGFFMLWELSLTDGESDRKIIPIFINDNSILRPMAGKKIMDALLNPGTKLSVHSISNLNSDAYEKLERLSMEFAYSAFVEMREKRLQKNKKSYNKYMYALQLRREAAEHVGIENIKRSRLARLQREEERINENFLKGQQVFPDFRMVLLVRLEA